MRPIVTHVAWSICLSVLLLVTIVSPAKTAEPIEMSFRMWICVCPKNHVLDVGLDAPREFGTLLALCAARVTADNKQLLLTIVCTCLSTVVVYTQRYSQEATRGKRTHAGINVVTVTLISV